MAIRYIERCIWLMIAWFYLKNRLLFRYVDVNVNGSWIRSISNGYDIFIEPSFNVDTTYWTVFIRDQPLINTIHMEEMHAWQSPNVILNFKQWQTYCTFFTAIIFIQFTLTSNTFVFMRKGISFNCFLYERNQNWVNNWHII